MMVLDSSKNNRKTLKTSYFYDKTYKKTMKIYSFFYKNILFFHKILTIIYHDKKYMCILCVYNAFLLRF